MITTCYHIGTVIRLSYTVTLQTYWTFSYIKQNANNIQIKISNFLICLHMLYWNNNITYKVVHIALSITHICIVCLFGLAGNRIGGVMVIVLATSEVDRRLEPRLGHSKDYITGSCCFSAKHALRSQSKDWLIWNRDNVSGWEDMSIRGMLFH